MLFAKSVASVCDGRLIVGIAVEARDACWDGLMKWDGMWNCNLWFFLSQEEKALCFHRVVCKAGQYYERPRLHTHEPKWAQREFIIACTIET